MPNTATDRNLLFGILALQMDFISRDALVAAMHAWVLDKGKPLGRILQDQGALTGDTHALLEALVQKHLALHGNDAEQSLAAVSSAGPIRADLRQIADPDVQASLVHVAARPALPSRDPVATISLGQPTGQGLRFRVLRPHARGGLGQVYVAHDEELHREVALKEMHDQHAHDETSRTRFLLEAEITGGLEHPGIVPVYGLGQYADGRPFYAMRFVKGDSLKDAIEKFHRGRADAGTRTLELRELLGRFIDVCQAIQYAHDRGVLHRDLKPGNIMLGKYGETMVVDWGLAKALGAADPSARSRSDEPALQPPSASGTAHTMQGSAVGTPQYMSPEQAAGRLDQLGPASDIYSLGATLYALLTGQPPITYEASTNPHRPDVAAVLRKVERGEFARPRQVKPDVHPALEAICLKAMAVKPQDRYASPSALIDDLKHWLAGEPVSAWREPWTIRTRRWIDRHRTLVTGLAAAVVVGLVSLSVATVLLAQANDTIQAQNTDLLAANVAIKQEIALKEEQRQLAKTRLGQSLEALSLFATDFRQFCEDALVPSKKKAELYERLIPQLERQVVDESAEGMDDAFRNRVWMYQTLAIVYLDSQRHDKARGIVAKGLKASDEWLKVKPGDPYAGSFRAAMLSLHGDTQLNDAERKATYREVEKLRRELAGNPGVDRFTPGRSLMQLADTLDKMQLFDESLKLREQVCQIQIEKAVEPEKLYESFDFWAWTCWKAYLERGTSEERKQALLEKSDELCRRALKYRPGARRTLERWSGLSRELGDQAYNLAKLAEANKKPVEAKKHADKALAYYQQLADIARQLALAPDLMYSQANYARSYYALGLMEKNLGKAPEARINFDKSRQVREQLLRDFGDTEFATMLRIDWLFSLVALGEHEKAVSIADKLRQDVGFVPALSGISYRLACIYSLSVAAVEEARAPAPLNADDKKRQAEYRDKALTALERSHRLGNQDFAYTRIDADFIPIRDDPRFTKILELEKSRPK
jgi:serine/threonine protein kinase